MIQEYDASDESNEGHEKGKNTLALQHGHVEKNRAEEKKAYESGEKGSRDHQRFPNESLFSIDDEGDHMDTHEDFSASLNESLESTKRENCNEMKTTSTPLKQNSNSRYKTANAISLSEGDPDGMLNDVTLTPVNQNDSKKESGIVNKDHIHERPVPMEIGDVQEETEEDEHLQSPFWGGFVSSTNRSVRSLFTPSKITTDTFSPLQRRKKRQHQSVQQEGFDVESGGIRRRHGHGEEKNALPNNSHNRNLQFSDDDYPFDDNLENDHSQRTHPFWRTYDDIIFLSLASQFGILFRIISSSLMSISSVFSTNSALFTNLPLNCLSCFLMGLFCSGEEAWKFVSTRGARKGMEELREVQLEAMERRMRRSQSLLLFPGKRKEGDLMQHYNNVREQDIGEEQLDAHVINDYEEPNEKETHTETLPSTKSEEKQQSVQHQEETSQNSSTSQSSEHQEEILTGEPIQMNEEMIYSIAHGWDINTSPQAMSSDLLLGLRVGFCGALSSFSSWNSSMVNLLRKGNVDDAIMGYIVGFALPIISYKIGVHAAVYIFVAKCRREKKREAKRGGYAIRLPNDNDDEYGEDSESRNNDQNEIDEENDGEQPAETPSLRAIATAVFMLSLVTQVTSLLVFKKPDQQQFAISLLFSPLGVICRWKLSKWNSRHPSFPLGTFTANMLSCSLSGSIGSLLAGNPGEEESIVLTSMISGFAGSLSTLATLVVQVLDLIDVVLFRLDGAVYAFVTIFWGVVIGLLTRSAVDWADEL